MNQRGGISACSSRRLHRENNTAAAPERRERIKPLTGLDATVKPQRALSRAGQQFPVFCRAGSPLLRRRTALSQHSTAQHSTVWGDGIPPTGIPAAARRPSAARNLNCSPRDVRSLRLTSTPARAQRVYRVWRTDARRSKRPSQEEPPRRRRGSGAVPTVVPQLLAVSPRLQRERSAEVAEGTRPSQQRRDGAGAAALGGELIGVGAPLEPQREPHYRSTRGAAQGGRHRATAPRRCAAEHLLNTSSPHTSRAPSQNPAARSRARPLPFIAPGHAPRASPSSSCCHKPHLRGDVRVLSANSRGYCCRHSRGAHPDKTTRGSRPRLPGRGAADAAGSTGIHLRVCCSLLNAPLLSSPGCIKLQLLSPGIKSLEVAAGRPAVPGREGSGCARLSTEPMQAEVGRGEVMATPCVALGCRVGEPLTTDSCGAGLPAAPSACKLKTTHIWLLLTAGRMQLDDFKVPSNPTILWLYDL